MLHWKITNRGFALWRVPRTHKAQQLQGRGTGNVSTARPSISKLQDVQIPQAQPVTLQSSEWGRGSELLVSNPTTPTTPRLKYQGSSTACTSSAGRVSASSSTLSRQNSSRGKFVFSPMCKQEKPWSRRFVQSKCDTLVIVKYMRNSKPAQKRHPRWKTKK